jgi:hypothetical protein
VRALRPLLLVLAAAAVGLVAGLLLLARGDDGLPPPDGAAQGRALWQRTRVEPSVQLFAEPVTAEAEFLVDPGRIDPSTLRLDARFDPYTQVSGERTETRAGDLVRIRFRFVLQCTAPACVPTGDRRELQFESAQVGYTRRDAAGALGGSVGNVRSQDIVGWPAFEVASRLGPFDVERARWRADVGALPEATVRSSPTALGAALLGSSALLALLGAGLLASLLRGRRAEEEPENEAPRQTSLERALAGVVATSSNGAGPEQRRSLERLARELSATGRAELAARARRLAWSPRGAARPEVDSLAADVRALVEEER